jgi:hypothetical protein
LLAQYDINAKARWREDIAKDTFGERECYGY